MSRVRYVYAGTLSHPGNYAYFWSSTVFNSSLAYNLYFNSTSVSPRNGNYRSYSRSIRCLASKVRLSVIDACFARYKITCDFSKIKISLSASFYFTRNLGDLGGSRTRIVGMKTRCTNRYTTRPNCKYI